MAIPDDFLSRLSLFIGFPGLSGFLSAPLALYQHPKFPVGIIF